MIDSLMSMPFIKFNKSENYYQTNTPFLAGECHYHKLDEELWIVISNIKVKKNITFKMLYNKNTPKNYHFLTLHTNLNELSFKLPNININIENKDRSWTLFKAGSDAINTHFKGQHSIFFSIYFTDKWMQKNIIETGELKNEVLEKFFDSDTQCLYLPNFLESKKDISDKIIQSIFNKNESKTNKFLLLKNRTLNLLSSFANELDNHTTIKTLNNISNKSKRKLFKAENILKNSICGKFPSISKISKEVGISETKLKSDFKEMFGVTMLQYFSAQQMKYAKDLLETGEVSIKEIAITLGYANASKFSARFQKFYNKLPSYYLK